MKTMLERDSQLMVQWVYCILCEYGRSYIGETGRPLAMRLRKHKHSLQAGLLQKSKLAHVLMKGVVR
jgi:predicted GIY-YIG superfamily endonuclease